jgi:hypothetical protein
MKVLIPVRAASQADFKVVGISFLFNGILRCIEPLSRRGKRLNKTREHLLTPTYAPDEHLSIKVAQPVPSLSISHAELPTELLAGEIVDATFVLTNSSTGQLAITGIRCLCSHPNVFMLGKQQQQPIITPTTNTTTATTTIEIPNNFQPNIPSSIPLDNGDHTLPPGSSISIPVTCRGDSVGRQVVSWIFVFSSPVSSAAGLSWKNMLVVLVDLLICVSFSEPGRP